MPVSALDLWQERASEQMPSSLKDSLELGLGFAEARGSWMRL